jgi:hypothetical protein
MFFFFFSIRIVGGGVQMGPLGTSATEWPLIHAPGDYDYGEFGGMKIGRGKRSTRKKPAPAPLCPSRIPLDQTRARTRAAAVGSQRLTAWAVARPWPVSYLKAICHLQGNCRLVLWYCHRLVYRQCSKLEFRRYLVRVSAGYKPFWIFFVAFLILLGLMLGCCTFT